ncbi:MAG: ABC transporter ATP-binding protein [Defluviitaleaceae bacterium]|nr:ABC transporter ATP-binding protein [Defluviitaleaceae bacterium]
MKIEIKSLVKEYKQGDQTISALKKVNLTITSGEFYSITGRSGSGKTTLLNIVAGLTTPTSGNVLLDGKDIFTLSDSALSLYRNATIGCVMQQHSVLANLTVLDNVRLPFHLAKREGDSAKEAYRLLSLMGIEDLAKRMPKRLSGGQIKRVVIARALINKPMLLLADEPTGDLDSHTTKEIMQTLKTVASEGTAILMVTHDHDANEYASTHFSMNDGALKRLS